MTNTITPICGRYPSLQKYNIMNKLSSLTIGISALNEEKNIANLIYDLLSQKNKNFKLKKIIVISDGSTDKTGKIVRDINSKKITLITHKKRMGKYYRENQITSMTNTDALAIFDADIRIKDKNLLEKMVNVVSNGADLASTRVFSNNRHTFFEKLLSERMDFQDRLFTNFNNGLNVYTCHGVARIFSKKLYKKIKYKPHIGEDAYSYFYAIKHNFKYSYVKNTQVLINVPSNLKDHLKQGVRYLNSRKEMAKLFGSKLTTENYTIPKKLYSSELLISILNSPFYFGLYILVNLYTRFCSLIKRDSSVLWDVATSSK